MTFDKDAVLLYAVTDRTWTRNKTLYEQVELALKGGITCLQLREKSLSEKAFLEEAMQIRTLCKEYDVPFFINDNVEIAITCQADGVHVGQEDMDALQVRQKVGKDMLVGVSVHSVEEALNAVRKGADYLGVGAMFASSTKKDASVLTRELLSDICSAVDIPVVAIGGIGKSNIGELAGTGVDGVALVSAIFSVHDIENECRLLRHLSEKMIEQYRS